MLGQDIGMEDVDGHSDFALVGKFSYSVLAGMEIGAWIEENWCPVLGYSPPCVSLVNGWFRFSFRNEADATQILAGLWLCGKSSLVLKRWHDSFDPAKERLLFRHLWVLLPGFPLHFWTLDVCVGIGNRLGRFLFVDESIFSSADKRVARILVEIDISQGLLEELTIVWREYTYVQKLDYWKVPFRCFSCRQTGHLKEDCPRPRIKQLRPMIKLLGHTPRYQVPIEIPTPPACSQEGFPRGGDVSPVMVEAWGEDVSDMVPLEPSSS